MSSTLWRARSRARRLALPFLLFPLFVGTVPPSLPGASGDAHSQTHARPVAQTHALRS